MGGSSQAALLSFIWVPNRPGKLPVDYQSLVAEAPLSGHLLTTPKRLMRRHPTTAPITPVRYDRIRNSSGYGAGSEP